MGVETSIEWTDSTWNPTRGCDKVSPGCKHCYAETFAERWRGIPGHPYEQGFDLRLVPAALDLPLRWRKPRRIFVNSMSDLFHKEVPFEFIEQVFAVMANAPQHTFQVLTKRAERMRAFFEHLGRFGQNVRAHSFMAGRPNAYRWPLPNVWLGVSVEDQARADERIPRLLRTPAAVRFLSVEPQLGPVDLSGFTRTIGSGFAHKWVIVGGESGSGARPFDLAWARSIVSQCKAAAVPVFVKQLGAHAMTDARDTDLRLPAVYAPCSEHGVTGVLSGRRLKLANGKGDDPSEWPEDLRVREFPAGMDSAVADGRDGVADAQAGRT